MNIIGRKFINISKACGMLLVNDMKEKDNE